MLTECGSAFLLEIQKEVGNRNKGYGRVLCCKLTTHDYSRASRQFVAETHANTTAGRVSDTGIETGGSHIGSALGNGGLVP